MNDIAVKPNNDFSSYDEYMKHIREVWKVALDTQMHFNDLLIRMRTTVISIILAVFGASALALRELNAPFIEVFKLKIHLSSIVLFIGIIFLIGQFLIDRFYYFKLLLGSVTFTDKIDKKFENNDKIMFGLTKEINKSISDVKATVQLTLFYAVPILLAIFVIILIQCNLPAIEPSIQ